MKAEREKLAFAPFNLSEQGGQVCLSSFATHRTVALSPLQAQYLARLKAGVSVEQLVLEYLRQGWLVRFGELHDLMHILLEEKLIQNPNWLELMTNTKGPVKDTKITSRGSQINSSDLAKLPFFQGLDEKLLSQFAVHAECYRTGPHTRLCVQGQIGRDLFGLLEGEVGVYRRTENESRRLICKIRPPAVFGEGGFLLNQPRSADVITTTDCYLIRLHHTAAFDHIIQSPQANSLHRRFWALHALAHSPLFRNLPLEIWDDLVVRGTIRDLPSHSVLFQEGTKGTSFGILIQGQLGVIQKTKRVNTLDQGACFGEVALLASQGVRSASIVADLPSMIIEIGAEQFYPLLARHLLLAKDLEGLAYRYLQDDAKRAHKRPASA